ncbi:MAG TPA: hypothetical protein VK911_09665 [Vicinamibacterales bacterium]|nr:hypothetical protein [Vicinamibacterales bacterium]
MAAILGVAVLLAATFLHPMNAPPGDAAAAFAEYAADQYWVATHLGQLLGAVLITGGLIALTGTLSADRARAWGTLGAAAAIANLSLAGALQAVDGIALKVMVDRWAAAAPEARPLALEGAFAVRQIEIGLASISIVFFGLTALLYATALLNDGRSRWPGWLGIVAGIGTVAAGVVQAHTGFSDLAMAATMPSNLLLLLWLVAVGVLMLRRGRG